MVSVLRARVAPALCAALLAASTVFAAPAPAGLSTCADGLGGTWIAERAPVADDVELRLVHVALDGTRAPAVTVRRTWAGRGLTAELRCDARGGAWIAWTEVDYQAARTEVRAAHVAKDGALAARGDEALASFEDLFEAVALLSDGRGGAYVAWREADARHDRHVRVARLAADGRAARGWPEHGLSLVEPAGNVRPRLVGDGEGGAIVVADADPNRAGAGPFALRVSPDAALLR